MTSGASKRMSFFATTRTSLVVPGSTYSGPSMAMPPFRAATEKRAGYRLPPKPTSVSFSTQRSSRSRKMNSVRFTKVMLPPVDTSRSALRSV
ncbi:hypothetical protein D3C85_952370 [compost metagenome]